MAWKDIPDLDDNTVVIGGKHEMNYAFSILARCKIAGYCTIIIEKDKVWTNRINGNQVRIEDNWEKVLALITKARVKTVEVLEIENGRFRKVIVE